MRIVRKFVTAQRVLRKQGFGEVLGLAKDNIANLYNRASYLFISFAERSNAKLAVRVHRKPAKPRILYITSEFEAFHSQTARYRIDNFKKALRGKAETVSVLIDYKTSFDDLIKWADIVVLMRVTWVPKVDEIIEAAKRYGTPVVFDIDDLIFLPRYVENYCRVLGDMSEENIKLRAKEFAGFEKTFKLCDYATASTPYIAEQMKKEGKKAFVIHNALNRRQLKIAERAKRAADGVRAIGYLSGTKTHDKDFEIVLPAITRIMDEYPDVRLNVAGYLDFDMLPEQVREKTRIAPYMRWTRLMKFGAQNYINIAPLDVENPFCHAKSELKYFEAAAVFVPTVASAVDTYKRCIENGVNGILATTTDEWYTALKKLLDDKDFYNTVSKNAHDSALEHYSPDANAAEALAAYNAIIMDFRGA